MKSYVTSRAFAPKSPTYTENDPDVFFVRCDSGERVATMAFGLPQEKAQGAVIFSHGNGEDIGEIRAIMREDAHLAKIAIYTYDYPGYGQSSGVPSEKGCFDAIKAVYEMVVAHGFESARIALWGRSIGSGPSLWLASLLERNNKETVAGVILECSIYSVVSTVFPKLTLAARISLSDIMLNYIYIKNVQCQVTFIHGKNDRIAPIDMARKLSSLAKNLDSFIELDSGHNDIHFKHKTQIRNCLNGLFPRLLTETNSMALKVESDDSDENWQEFQTSTEEEQPRKKNE